MANTVIIPCPHSISDYRSCRLTMVFTYQKFESLYYIDVNGQVVSTPYSPASTVVESNPMNPFCRDCKMAFLAYFLRKCDCPEVFFHLFCKDTRRILRDMEVENRSSSSCHCRRYSLDIQTRLRRPFTDEELTQWAYDHLSSTGAGPTPAAKTAIEALETVAAVEVVGREENCMVCLDGLLISGNDGDYGVIKRLPCQHVFHNDCIVKWLNTSHMCPLCRFELKVDESNAQELSFRC